MSIKAYAWAKSVKAGSPTLKAVLCAIADYADDKGRAFPSFDRVAEDTEFTDRAVRKAVAELAALGLLTRQERFRPDGGRSTDVLTLQMHLSAPLERGSTPLEPASKGVEGRSPPPEPDATPPSTTFTPITTTELPSNGSEANASAEPASADPAAELSDRDRLWFEGRPLLIECGLSHNRAGEVIGRWIGVYRDSVAILGAIRRARSEATQAPIPFVVAVLEASERRARASPASKPRSGGQFLADFVNGNSSGGSDDTGSDPQRGHLRIAARTCH
jgi:hypothetical protein